MMREPEVAYGIMVANVSDHVVEELLVVRELSVFDVLSDDVAKQAAEVFVTREGEEGAGVGKHSYEVRKQAD